MGCRRIPYIVLLVLLLLLTFIGGIRYGREVVQKDAIISYLLTLTPIPSITSPAVNYQVYEHKQCGVSFTYPSTLIKEKESSISAVFKTNTETVLTVTCGATPEKRENFELVTVVHPRTGKKIHILVEKTLKPLIKNSLEFK